jgi:hypothetical protein
MPGSVVFGIKKSVMARRCLLRSTYDKAHCRDEGPGIFLADLP